MKKELVAFEFECEYCGTHAHSTGYRDNNNRFLIPHLWHYEENVRTSGAERYTEIVHVCPDCFKRRNNDKPGG